MAGLLFGFGAIAGGFLLRASGDLQLRSPTPGAVFELAGRGRCAAPCSFTRLTPGRYRVGVLRANTGSEPELVASQWVNVRSGDITTLTVELPALRP